MTRPSEVEHGWAVFPFRGLELVSGKGSTVTDAAGRSYLDVGGANYGTMNVGHAHPRVVAAIERAAPSLTHLSQVFAHPVRSAFVDAVRAMAGPWAGRVFLSNSGSEAVEAAIKLAMATTGRAGLVAAEGGFHGRTLGALAATHKAVYRGPFEGRLGPTTHVPFNDADALTEAVSDATAAVVLEPVQGEGGVRAAEPAFLQAARDLSTDHGALLVLDEVQTGIARTGTDLAVHAYGIEPDVVCLAKSVAAGLPLGVTIAHERLGALGTGLHGSTFGGSPLACAAGLEVLGILADEALAEAARVEGDRLAKGLARLDHDLLREVRARGLMIGIELATTATPVLRALQAGGVLALPAGENVVRLLPPLVLTDDEADRTVSELGQALDAVAARFEGAAPR